MNKKISIIVPIYNVEKYLTACLCSLYDQFNSDLMEVILVNDGSTDNSLSICRQFKERYPDTILIDKPNGGLSDARNAGISIVQGEYLYFLDSDDWLSPDALIKLYQSAVKYQCDIMQGGFYYAYDHYLLLDKSLGKREEPITMNKEEAMRLLISNRVIKNFAWGKLYRTTIVKRHLFKKGVYFEDIYWQHHVINEVERYGIRTEPMYYYRQRNDSISGAFSLRSLDLLKGYEERIEFIKENYPTLTLDIFATYWNSLFSNYQSSKSQNDEKIKEIYKQYWYYAHDTYQSEFQMALKHSLTYRLTSNQSVLLPCFLLFKRICNRFRKSSFEKILIE